MSDHKRDVDRPHCEPDAHLTMFAAVLVAATEHELLEEPSDHIHDCESWCDADECKREFLGLEQFVDARQSLVNVDLGPVSSRNPKRSVLYEPLLFAPARTTTLAKCQPRQT